MTRSPRQAAPTGGTTPGFSHLNRFIGRAMEELSGGTSGNGFRRFFSLLLIVVLCGGGFGWILGNAALDIWCASIICLAVADLTTSHPARRRYYFQEIKWIVLATVVLLIWGSISALLNDGAREAFIDFIQYARFPLLALGLVLLLSDRPALLRLFMVAFTLALLLLSIILLQERLSDLSLTRSYGAWGQGPFINAYVSSAALIACAYWLREARSMLTSSLVVLAGCLFTFVAFSTGEVYLTMILAFALVIMFALAPRTWLAAGGLGALSIALGVWFFQKSPWLWSRMIERVPERLPWRESSDYFSAWTNALTFGKLYPLTGVGPGRFADHCIANETSGALELLSCNDHPHHIYLQFFAELGVPGLILFFGLVVAIIALAIRRQRASRWIGLAGVIALLVACFWPISTFGDAFGQLRNFFLWLMIGMALVFSTESSTHRH